MAGGSLGQVVWSGVQMPAFHCILSPPRHVVRSPTGLLRRLRLVPSALKARQSLSLRTGKLSHESGVVSMQVFSGMILVRRAVFWSVLFSPAASSLRGPVIPGGLSLMCFLVSSAAASDRVVNNPAPSVTSRNTGQGV